MMAARGRRRGAACAEHPELQVIISRAPGLDGEIRDVTREGVRVTSTKSYVSSRGLCDEPRDVVRRTATPSRVTSAYLAIEPSEPHEACTGKKAFGMRFARQRNVEGSAAVHHRADLARGKRRAERKILPGSRLRASRAYQAVPLGALLPRAVQDRPRASSEPSLCREAMETMLARSRANGANAPLPRLLRQVARDAKSPTGSPVRASSAPARFDIRTRAP